MTQFPQNLEKLYHIIFFCFLQSCSTLSYTTKLTFFSGLLQGSTPLNSIYQPIVLMLALSKEIWQAHLVNTLHILQTFFSLQRRSKNFSHHSKKTAFDYPTKKICLLIYFKLCFKPYLFTSDEIIFTLFNSDFKHKTSIIT